MQPVQQQLNVKVQASTLNEIERMTPHAMCAVMDRLLSPGEAARLLADEIQAGLIVEACNG